MKNEKITSEDFEEKSNVNDDKKTKNKSNAQKAMPIMIVLIVTLVIILTCVLIAYYQVYTSSRQNANILEGVYSSSYYSMVDNVNNLAVDCAKYSNMSTTEGKLTTMSNIKADCNYILAGLSVLPIDEENVSASTRFFNQVNGVCDAYIAQINSGKELTMEQELIFDKIALVVGEIKSNFNKQAEGYSNKGFNFIDASVFDRTGMNELSADMGDLTSANIDYPAMIFDGPFSTALETKTVKGLKGDEVSVEQAKEYLKATVYSNRDDVEIEYENETQGTISTLDFKVTVDGKIFNVQVSKVGGLLITVSGYAEVGDPILNREDAITTAEKFANRVGFENMKAVWAEVNKNIAYINLAPVVDNVIYYPDLVKVKIDLTAKEVIGFEALNYALNHTNRELTFNLTAEDVESLLGFDYNVIKVSKALIRLESGKEIETYEFITEKIDGDYFYYLNANKKEISKVMKLVKIKDVEKLI